MTKKEHVRRLLVSGLFLLILAAVDFFAVTGYASSHGSETVGVVVGGIVSGALAINAVVMMTVGVWLWRNKH